MLRRQVGAAPPPELAKALDWDDRAESEIHEWAMREQLPATAVQALFDFYIDHVALPGTVGAEVEAQFRQMAQRAGLKAKQIDQLISWHRAFAAGVQ